MTKKGVKILDCLVLITYEVVLGREDVWLFIDLTKWKTITKMILKEEIKKFK